MTKVLLLLLVLVSVLSSSKCGKIVYKSNTPKEFLKYFTDKCIAATGKDEPVLQTNVIEMQSCLMSSSKIHQTEDLYTFICKIKSGYECAELLMSALEPCLYPEEKYLSNFILSAHNASTAQLCEDGKEMFLNKINTLKQSECMQNRQFIESAISCTYVLNDVLLSDSLILSQQLICGKMEEYKKCFVEDLEQNCINDDIVDFVRHGLEPYTHWCDVN